MKKIVVSLVGVMLSVSGCSTLSAETMQIVDVQLSSSGTAVCELRDEKTTYHVNAPGIVEVNRGDGPLVITCMNGSATGTLQVEEDLAPSAIWAEKPGLLLDVVTGSYQQYPRQAVVPMSQ